MADEKKEPEQGGDMSKTFEEVLEMLQSTTPADPSMEGLDIDQVVERLEGALEQLNGQMEEVYSKTGMTAEQVEEYASNPDNFSEEEWSLLQQIRGQLDKFQEEAEDVIAGLPEEVAQEVGAGGEEEKPTSKKRRRRKHWLQS